MPRQCDVGRRPERGKGDVPPATSLMDVDLAVVVVNEPQAHLLGVLRADQSLGKERGGAGAFRR